MLRHNRSIEGLIDGQCKIRKRGCSPSSSTSSVLQNYRFKRAILVGKRGGSSTPVPTWKMSSRSPYSVVGIAESPKYPPSQNGGCGSKAKQVPVSARKLAATLWEMNEIPSPRLREDFEERRIKKEMRYRDRIKNRSVHSGSGSLPPHLSDPSHSPVSDRMDRSGTGSIRRRTSAISQRVWLTDYNGGGFDSLSSASLMEIEMRSRGQTPKGSIVGVKTRLKDLSNGLTTSKELLKILNRFWGLEEQHSSSLSLMSALHAELERAHVLVDQLIREQRSDKYEIDYLMKRFAEEKASWKSKEKERIRAAVETVVGDLEVERKLRRRSESLNKKLGIEMAETKAVLSKTIKELQSEKRERLMTKQVCEELVRGAGEDKAEVEELRMEYAKVQEEVEKERERLQLADALREERHQMKVSGAKFRSEEKSAAVGKLRNELEAFLKVERAKETRGTHLSKTRVISDHNEDKGDDEGEVEDGEEVDPEEEDSAESDLHSIELNMDNNNNNNRDYNWRYTTRAAQVDPKRVSVEGEIKGRKSTSDKIPRRSISIEKHLSDGIDWDFVTENYSNLGDGYDRGRFSGPEKQNQEQEYEDETHRYKSVKGLRDHILSSSRMTSAQGFASPTRQWGQPRPSRDHGSSACEGPSKARESCLKKEREVEARGGWNLKHLRQ